MRIWMFGVAVLAAGLLAPTAGAAVPDLDVRGDRDAAHAGRNDGLLTGPSSATPERIALDHFGHSDLKLVARAVSPDGITHLRFNQVLDGIESYDSGLEAHVTRDGRLISGTDTVLRGARLAGKAPAVSALAGLGEARRSTRGLALPPRVTKSSAAAATFATGEAAKLRWIATGGGPRLAWDVYTEGEDDQAFSVIVDAESGETLVRVGLTEQLGRANYFPADPDSTLPVEITMPPAWYDQHAGGTRLWGQYARTYVDANNENPAPGAEMGGARVQIPASDPAALDWLYTRSTAFPGATPCPFSGCSWNSAIDSTRTANQFQVATNVHVLTGRYLEHLAQPPIGFDEPSGSFGGNDYVQVEINGNDRLNNASFGTPRDGTPPRMQTYLGTTFDTNFGDIAGVVYHEIGHGLSSRLVVNAAGNVALFGQQPSMMGEAWSDFYAFDFLVDEGHMTDTDAPGELKLGTHAVGTNGIRSKPIDCPVNPAGLAGCNRNGTATAVLGGYTFGDLKSTNNGPSPHNGGEVWAQTLWDLRRAVGREPALALVTGGLRLAPDNPTMLDARDAIVRQALAMRTAPDTPDDYFAEAWEVFRVRGMGFGAATTGPDDTTPTESFSSPWTAFFADPPTIADPYPGGDNDGRAEPGERVAVSATLSAALADLPGLTGTLSSPVATIEDGTAAWPPLGSGRTATNADPLVARMPAGCDTAVPLTVTVTSPGGTSAGTTTLDLRPASRAVTPLVDAPSDSRNGVTNLTYEVASGATVSDVDLRIGELRHPFLGDLTIQLIHAGETVTVFDPPTSWDADDIVDAIFDSDAATAPPGAGAGPVTGRFRPSAASALDRFDGKPAGGVWTLRITDGSPRDAGVLRAWALDGPRPEFPCPRLEIPAVVTDAAGDLTPDGATLHGAVEPNGRATGLRFAWGTTEAYGSTTPVQDAGAGDDAVAGFESLTGLAPETTYHYRVEAIREGGVVAVAGSDQTFTTPAIAVPTPEPTASPQPTAPAVSHPTPTPAPTAAPGADRRAPAFAGRPKVTLVKAGRANRRATFSFTLSEPARVSAAVTMAAKGIRRGSKCVAVPRRKPKGARPCTRQVDAARGAATVTSTGSLTLPKQGLGKGRYTAVLTAVDAAGNAGRATVTFTIRST